MTKEWQIIELLGYGYFARKGYRIFVPLVNFQGYDFVAEKDGKFTSVNVKVAGLKNPSCSNSWSISQPSGGSKGFNKIKIKCDVYLVYLPKQERFIELSGDFLDVGNSKSRLIPKNMLTAK
jgi:hypothetical protein